VFCTRKTELLANNQCLHPCIFTWIDAIHSQALAGGVKCAQISSF
jgi:hypothetical protein